MYMMLYSIYYNLTELDMSGVVPIILYFGYMGLISFTLFLVAGTIGFLSSLWFTHRIYASIKVD